MKKMIALALWLGVVLLVTVPLTVTLAAPPSDHGQGDGRRTRTPTRTATPRPATPTRTPTSVSQPTATPAPTETPRPLTITTTSMPDGNVGTNYGNFITSEGGQGSPHRFRIIAGQLPDGLTMAESFGVQSTSVTGTPSRVQTTTFTVEVRDPAGNTDTQVLSITINPPRTLVITNQSSTLFPGTLGQAYATGLFADGGIKPYNWAIVAGQLPPGLQLNGNVIQGTPTTRGTFTFTARVSDSGGQQASQQFSLTIN